MKYSCQNLHRTFPVLAHYVYNSGIPAEPGPEPLPGFIKDMGLARLFGKQDRLIPAFLTAAALVLFSAFGALDK